MSNAPEASRREATLLAHIILDWHRKVGVKLADQKMSAQPDSLAKYMRLVAEFAESDLSKPHTQIEIARQQISGMFEWFYGEEISPEIVQNVAQRGEIECQSPLHLNEAAKRILAINERLHDGEPERSRGRRTVVRFSGREDLLKKAGEIYRDFAVEENIGIGGANFLLACSLERCASLPLQDEHNLTEVTLVDHSVLGVQRVAPNELANDFLDHLRSKKLLITTSVGM